jgi:dTDP-4-amino-4,6-dideoxygalactose transaminase
MTNYIWRHDLTPQYERFEAEIIGAVKKVFRSGRYILNGELEAFEQEFASYIGCGFAVGVGSGTDALFLALRASGVGKEDEVITTTYAPTPTPAAILMAGARPVFVDLEPGTCLMNPALIEENLTPRTKAILPVHLFGIPCKMEKILSLGKKYRIPVIEDAAQAHGSLIGSRKAGSVGDLSCFSFYPTKNLGGYGDGGAVLTYRRDFKEALNLYRNYGKKYDPFNSEIPGVNSRLDEIQAAILRVKLHHLDSLNRERADLVRLYQEGLRNEPLQFLPVPEGVTPNHHILTVRCPSRRDDLMKYLESRGIQTNVYYPKPLHCMSAYKEYVKEKQTFPEAEKLSFEALALPLYSELKPGTVEFIVGRIREFFGRR